VADAAPCQADKLLSPEFQLMVEPIIALLPQERQIMLFSATFPVTVKCACSQRFARLAACSDCACMCSL